MLLERIKELREDNDITEKEICNYLNIQQPQYSRYENGRAQPKIEIIIKIAEFYQTSTDYILKLTNIQKPYPRNRR